MFKKYLVVSLMFFLILSSAYAKTPIKLTVAAAPGGPSDAIARVVKQFLSEETDLKITIEYKPGAGGEIAYTAVANNNTDPNLIIIYQSFVVFNSKDNNNYNWRNDLVMVNYLGHGRLVLLTGKNSDIKSWTDLKNWPKNKPLTIGVAGIGTAPKLCADFLQRHLDKDWMQIEYKSGGPALIDLMGGHHAVGCHVESAVRGHLESGMLIPLASIGTQRLASLPNLPSTDQLGIKDDDLTFWSILGANKMVDNQTIEKINRAMARIMQDPEKRKKFLSMSAHLVDMDITVGGTAAATKFMEQHISKFKK